MQLNKEMNIENIRALDAIINELISIKTKLETNNTKQDDVAKLEEISTRQLELSNSIENSSELVSFMKPYLKKCGSTYNITISPDMANKIGFLDNERSVIYIPNESSRLLMVKKINKNENDTQYRIYKVSKSKETKKGISYNLGIPKKALDKINCFSGDTLRIAVRKGVIEITKKI